MFAPTMFSRRRGLDHEAGLRARLLLLEQPGAVAEGVVGDGVEEVREGRQRDGEVAAADADVHLGPHKPTPPPPPMFNKFELGSIECKHY